MEWFYYLQHHHLVERNCRGYSCSHCVICFLSKLSDCAGDCVWNHFNDNLLSTGYRIKYKFAGITVLGTEETGMQGEGTER